MKAFFVIISLFFIASVSVALNPVREYETTPADYGMNYKNQGKNR